MIKTLLLGFKRTIAIYGRIIRCYIKSWKGGVGFSVNADVAIEESNRRVAHRHHYHEPEYHYDQTLSG